ncbi:MAG TPA: FliM/FliN family flagellar motor switch protein [Candidatus Acidoferrum sp.]|nr:FliM/FliN family flagellar motor switch protein [Candidatus Acidoferrum sp.]
MCAAESKSGFATFVDAWRQGLTQTLSEAGLKAVKVEFVDAKTSADRAAKAGAKSHRLALIASGQLRGSLKLITSESEALRLSLLLAPAPEKGSSQLDDNARDSFKELLCRAAAKTAAFCGQDETKLELVPEASGSATTESICGRFQLSADNFGAVTLVLTLSADLIESIRGLEGTPPAADSKETQKGASVMPVSQSTGPSSNLGLLFDVKLEATIRFGGRQLLLRDILSLSPGAVIELDRQVGEPAELLVAGRLVARGEVVVVDGNFALRVTELCGNRQPNELVQA